MRRGNVARSLLQVTLGHQGGQGGEHQGRHGDLPGQRLLSDQVRPGRDQARRSARRDQANRGRGGGRPREALDAHHRNSRALQRSLDARDLDALPRPAPGAGHDRHRIHRQDQQSRRRGGLHQGPFRRALVRLDGRLRRRPAVSLSDGRPRPADPVAQISAPAHGHAEAHNRSRRLLRLHLFGARRRRLPDVRHHADADLRSQPADQLSARFHVPVQSRRHRQMAPDRAAPNTIPSSPRWRPASSRRKWRTSTSRSTISTPTSTEPTPS